MQVTGAACVVIVARQASWRDISVTVSSSLEPVTRDCVGSCHRMLLMIVFRCVERCGMIPTSVFKQTCGIDVNKAQQVKSIWD